MQTNVYFPKSFILLCDTSKVHPPEQRVYENRYWYWIRRIYARRTIRFILVNKRFMLINTYIYIFVWKHEWRKKKFRRETNEILTWSKFTWKWLTMFLECTLNRNSKQREIRSYRLRGHFANNQEQSTISSRSPMGLVWLTNSMDSQSGTRSIRYDMQAFRCPLHG